MALQLDARPGAADDIDPDNEVERRWAETIVTVMATSLAVLFVSSIAVVMFFA